MSILPLTYQMYEEFSTKYIIDIHSLNQYIIDQQLNPTFQVEDWMVEHCYYILLNKLMDQFTDKINHNLVLAKKKNDVSYVNHIVNKLHINVNQLSFEYTPNRIKLSIKGAKKQGFSITNELAKVLNVHVDVIFKNRSDIIKLIHKYIYQNKLQNQYDRQTITPDDTLSTLLSPLTGTEIGYTYMTLPTHLGHLITCVN